MGQAWLSESTGQSYDLLSEAEWEYVARAGTTTSYWWVLRSLRSKPTTTVTKAFRQLGQMGKSTVPVGHFEANPWGLYNVHGNVSEWCEDIWHENYNGAPADGSAWLNGGDPSARIIRGGSWYFFREFLRSAYRNRYPAEHRNNNPGFRVRRKLPPKFC